MSYAWNISYSYEQFVKIKNEIDTIRMTLRRNVLRKQKAIANILISTTFIVITDAPLKFYDIIHYHKCKMYICILGKNYL